ncbi:tetratricopeptide repeat protein [Enterovibrio sp. 27052020O]|uniref:tetratricopeptide repeat protein n=1 Tax=Enterovibrio sp. 27052020O TaxID=3241166 RepID=UPI00388FB837
MKWLLPLSIVISTVSCSEEVALPLADCPTVQNYSEAFLDSDFYEGWRHLQRGNYPREQCQAASPYFLAGVKNDTVFELSTLYLDFCSETPDVDALNGSSIYHSKRLKNGIDYDEFKWVLDLALCNSPVEQYALGKMLHDGFVTDQDTEKGIYFLSLAAHQDHIQAQIALAEALVGIDEHDIAARWLEKARNNGGQTFAGRNLSPNNAK